MISEILKMREQNEEMQKRKLGDAFNYAMLHEFQEVIINPEEKPGKHLFACLAYMNINGYLDNDTVFEIERELAFGQRRADDIQNIAKTVVKRVFTKLMEKYHFTSYDELITQLNNDTIPNWYFDIGHSLVRKRNTRPFVYENYLYYIVDNEKGIPMFVRLRTEIINDEEELDEYEEKQILGIGYEAIYGFDKKNKRVYLKGVNQKNIYQCYDLLSKTFVIFKGLFLKMHNGAPVIVTEENDIAYILDEGKTHVIKKYDDGEEYRFDEKSSSLTVFPKSEHTKFFYPYHVTFCGEIKEADLGESRAFIWNKLCRITEGEYSWKRSFLFRHYENKNQIAPPSTLTVNAVMTMFEERVSLSNRCTNEKCLLFENIFKLLANFVEENEDLTRLLYALFEANRKIKKNYDMVFPSEGLYLGLAEIERDELSVLLKEKDYERLIFRLSGDSVDKKNLRLEEEMIGEFRWNEGELVILSKINKEDGIVMGNLVVPPVNLKEFVGGFVSYNYLTDKIHVTSTVYLPQEAQRQIIKRYKLIRGKVIFSTLKDCGEMRPEEMFTNRYEQLMDDERIPFFEGFEDLGDLFGIADYSDFDDEE